MCRFLVSAVKQLALCSGAHDWVALLFLSFPFNGTSWLTGWPGGTTSGSLAFQTVDSTCLCARAVEKARIKPMDCFVGTGGGTRGNVTVLLIRGRYLYSADKASFLPIPTCLQIELSNLHNPDLSSSSNMRRCGASILESLRPTGRQAGPPVVPSSQYRYAPYNVPSQQGNWICHLCGNTNYASRTVWYGFAVLPEGSSRLRTQLLWAVCVLGKAITAAFWLYDGGHRGWYRVDSTLAWPFSTSPHPRCAGGLLLGPCLLI